MGNNLCISDICCTNNLCSTYDLCCSNILCSRIYVCHANHICGAHYLCSSHHLRSTYDLRRGATVLLMVPVFFHGTSHQWDKQLLAALVCSGCGQCRHHCWITPLSTPLPNVLTNCLFAATIF